MTCEELLADIQLQDAKIQAADIQIEASNLIKSAAQTQKWIDLMNYMLQGCGGSPPMGMAATEGVAIPKSMGDMVRYVLNPPDCVLAEIAKDPAKSLLMEFAKLYWGGK